MRGRATSSGLKTIGTLRGSLTNVRRLTRSSRSSVTLKKNRSAELAHQRRLLFDEHDAAAVDDADAIGHLFGLLDVVGRQK